MSKKEYTMLAIGIFIAFLMFGIWLFYRSWFPYTSDAYVKGNPVVINALRDGVITQIHTDDSFLVKQNDVVVELNRTDVDIKFAKAREQLALATRQISEAYHRVFRLQAEVKQQQALLSKAAIHFNNRKAVVNARAVSQEEFQFAQDDFQAAQARLRAKTQALEEAYAFIQGQTIQQHPRIQSAAWSVREAWVARYRSRIRAPVTGLVANRKAQVGMVVKHNLPLMNIIPLNQIWVNANFKETDIKHVRLGQTATLWSDYYGPSLRYHGTVVGLPGAAGNVFSLLPTQNLSGNWIKIVQRLPVRISLDPEELNHYPLRLGLSMHVTVNATTSGLMLPTSNANAPHYHTMIFEEEEKGVQSLIDDIILANMDPTLALYRTKPLRLTMQPRSSQALA